MDEELGPIDIEFIINNREVIAQAEQMQRTLTELNDRVQASAQQTSQTVANVVNAESATLETMAARSIEGLKVQLAQYRQLAALTTDETRILALNQSIQQTETEITRLSNIGRAGFNEFGERIDVATASSSKFLTVLKSIAIYTGIAFIIGKITQTIGNIIELTKKAEGVQAAFDRINSPDLLNNLRAATKGTVSDLLLMQKAILASSENFPVDKLATFYQFALVKSRELGKSTDEVLQKLIDGALKGRASVFTALGINNKEIQDSVKKTGDFTESVLTLIQDQLKKTGSQADNTADRFGRISATVEDIETNVGKSSTGILAFVGDLVQKQLNLIKDGIQELDDRLTELGKKFAVQDNSKLVEQFTNDTPQGRASSIKGYQLLIAKQAQAVADYDKKIQDTQNNLSLLQRIGRAAFTDLNDELENKRNQQVVLLAEYKGELATINGIVDSENQKKEAQRLKDDANAKARAAAAKELQNEQKSLLNSQIAINEKIKEFENKTTTKYLDPDQQAIAQVHDQFAALIFQIGQANAKYDEFVKKFGHGAVSTFNANPANKVKLTRTDPASLIPLETAAVNNQANLNENNHIQQDIDLKKKLYADYYAFREKVGSAVADKEYKDLLVSGKDFTTYLDNLKKSVPADDQSGPIQKRRELIKKAQKQNAEDQQKAIDQLLAQYASYAGKREGIILTAQQNEKQLRDKGENDQADQVAVFTKEQLDALDEENFKKLAAYKELFDNIDTITTQRGDELLKVLRTKLDAAYLAGNLTQDAYNKFVRVFNQASLKINDKIPQGLKEIGAEFQNISSAVSGFDENLGRAVATVGNLVSGIGSIQGNLANIQSSTSDGFSKASSGLAIVGTAISVITSIVGLFDHSKEQAEQLQYTYELQQKQIEAVNKSLERQLALTKQIYGPERLTAYAKALADITAAQEEDQNKINQRLTLIGDKQLDAAITKLNNGEKISKFESNIIDGFEQLGRITSLVGKSYEELQKLSDEGKLDANTQALVQSLIDLKQQAIDTQNAINEEFTGSSFDSITSDIASLFQNATSAAADFGNDFTKIIQQSLFKGFETKYLDTQLQNFYNDLAKYAQADDGVLSKDSIQKLRDEYDTIIKNAQAQAAQIQAATGVAVSAPGAASSNTFTGQIKGITEDTANALEGAVRGMQLAVVKTNDFLQKGNFTMEQQLSEIRSQTLLQMQIVNNTKRTADNSDKMVDSLRSIDKNGGDTMTTLLRSAGLINIK